MSRIRTYTELIQYSTFEDRFNYLQLHGRVGLDTFGFDRIFYQNFLHSKEWRGFRNHVISRDLGRDLGIEGREIPDGIKIIIHHMNPITMKDIEESTEFLLNPEYVITTTDITHKAIHYGDKSLLMLEPEERRPNDTCLWRR